MKRPHYLTLPVTLPVTLAVASLMGSQMPAAVTFTDTTNITVANAQVETGGDTSDNPDVSGGMAGALLSYTETSSNTYGCCGAPFGRANLNDGDIGLGVASDGTYALPDAGGPALVFDFGSTVSVGSISIYNGYGNRDDGDYVLSDGSGNTLGAWTLLTTGGGSNEGMDSFWLTFNSPVVTDQLTLSYTVGDCCGTPSFREVQVFEPVPEPSFAALLALAGAFFLTRRPRR